MGLYNVYKEYFMAYDNQGNKVAVNVSLSDQAINIVYNMVGSA